MRQGADLRVFVDSDFAGDPVSRKSATGLVAQIGNHTVKSGSTFQGLKVLSVGEAEIYAAVKGDQVGLFLRSIFQDLGVFWVQARVHDGDLSVKKVLGENLCSCRTGILLTMNPTLHYRCRGIAHYLLEIEPTSDVVIGGAEQKNRNRQLSALVVNIETGAKPSDTMGTVDEFGTSHDEWTMTREERRREAKQWQDEVRNFVNTDSSSPWRLFFKEPTNAR